MGNLILNKPATASSFVLPYSPSRALDGSIAPTSRWETNKFPAYMSVTMGGAYWINRWIVRMMGSAGWTAVNPSYNMVNYKLQGSNDNANWFDIDSVSNNQASMTDRTFTAVKYSFVRLYVGEGSGNAINQKLASCMSFEVYEAPPTSSYLSALTISSGTLTPAFSQMNLNYTVEVENSVASVTLTPTSIDGGTITINGAAVTSGQASQAINLSVGANAIPIVVTSRIGGLVVTYNVTITRKANPWLTNLIVKNSGGTILATSPTFSPTTMEYTINTEYDLPSTPDAYSVSITPSAVADSTISVNNVTVVSGQASTPISLATGNNTVKVIVTSGGGTVTKEYTLTINRSSNSNLKTLAVKNGKSTLPMTPSFSQYVVTYDLNTTVGSVIIQAVAVDSSAEIKVNGTPIQSSGISQAITLNTGLNTILVTVTPTIGSQIKTYTIRIQK